MQLVYLWIRSFGCLNECGFNLKPTHAFDFNADSKELTYTFLSNQIEYFYDRDEKIDLTAIVGNNGSGKTTFLELLYSYLAEGNGGIQSESLFVFLDNNERFYLYYCLPDNNVKYIKMNVADEFKYRFDLVNDNCAYNKTNIAEVIEAAKGINFIYLSQIFDNRYYNIKKYGKISDISTTSLIQSNKRIQMELNFLNPIQDPNLDFFYHEFSKQISFITTYPNFEDMLQFKLPENVFIKIRDVDFLKEALYKRIETKNLTSRLEKIFTDEKKRAKDGDEYFKSKLIENIFILLLNEFSNVLSKGLPEEAFNEVEKLITKHEITSGFWDKLKSIISDISSSTIKVGFFAKKYLNFIEWIDKEINNIGDFTYIRYENTFFIPTQATVNYVGIKNFFDHYHKTAEVLEYLSFSWGLSTGENSLLSLFARFYSLSEKIGDVYKLIFEKKVQSQAIILIDEADLTFHPQWQQKYINLLLPFIKNIYSDCQIKVIIATHSPIILSDIPKQNVIFMRGDDGHATIVNSKDRRETFSGNISSLFYDSFFMQKGSIGDFSSKFIQTLIYAMQPKANGFNVIYPLSSEVLEKLRLTEETDVEKRINLIGESIIRTKLFDMWDMCKYNGTSKELAKKRLECKIKRCQLEIENMGNDL